MPMMDPWELFSSSSSSSRSAHSPSCMGWTPGRSSAARSAGSNPRVVAGAALYAFASRGRARPTLHEWGAAAIVGAALVLVGNGGVAWAETRLDSGFAALIVAIIPLYVALMDRAVFGRRLFPAAIVGLVIGFAGVALLVRPGGGGNVGVALALVATTSAWAAG